MRIALFITCLTDTLRPETGIAVERLLTRLGHEVVFPAKQTCCGQMHFNSGYRPEALQLAEKAVRDLTDCDVVVLPSGSCAGMMRHGYDSLRRGLALPHAYELSELLVDVLGVTDVGAHFPHHVTYHPTCHSLRVLRVGDKPLQLLRAVRGIDLVELAEAESCCGFGGTFAVKNADVSAAMLADKIDAVRNTGANVLTAGDNSCLTHIGGGMQRLAVGTRAVHLAEILASTEADPWHP